MVPKQYRQVALVAIAVVTIFLVARSQLVPESFGAYGHYRGNSVAEIAALPIRFAGEEACLECHAGVDEAKIRSRHAPVRCEACHGPANEHALDPAVNFPLNIENAVALCLRCHEKNPTRPPEFPQVDSREHRPGIDCIGCHDPHSPKEEAPWKEVIKE